MDFSTALSAQDKATTQMQVDAFNKALNNGRVKKNELDKDDFLKILLTQLSHQDPTKPMEDKEFIAQMAQFSSLEQMTNMSSRFTDLSSTMKSSQAMSLVGQQVEIVRGETVISGQVEAATNGSFPQVLVNGAYYDYDDISKVTR